MQGKFRRSDTEYCLRLPIPNQSTGVQACSCRTRHRRAPERITCRVVPREVTGMYTLLRSGIFCPLANFCVSCATVIAYVMFSSQLVNCAVTKNGHRVPCNARCFHLSDCRCTLWHPAPRFMHSTTKEGARRTPPQPCEHGLELAVCQYEEKLSMRWMQCSDMPPVAETAQFRDRRYLRRQPTAFEYKNLVT